MIIQRANLQKSLKKVIVPFVIVDSDENLDKIAKEKGYKYFVQEEPYSEKAFLKSHLSGGKGIISLSKNISKYYFACFS